MGEKLDILHTQHQPLNPTYVSKCGCVCLAALCLLIDSKRGVTEARDASNISGGVI